MNFSEEIINDGGGAIAPVDGVGPVANMTEAFRQASWECGKIDCACDMTETRLAFLELTLGYELLNGEHCNALGYFGVLAPTGNSVQSEYLFQPVVGYGKHTGLMFGTSANVMLWADETEERQLNYYFHLNGMYLTSRNEDRLIDVINKPWSRFMRVYADRAQAEQANELAADFDPAAGFIYTPGVNIFCQEVKVKPGFQRTYTNSFVYTRYGFTGELGYSFFARPAECVSLACPWVEESAFASYVQPLGSAQAGATDSVQKINDIFDGRNSLSVDQYDQNIIRACDLDMQSAAHPGMLTHTFYGSVGYRWDDACRYPFFIGAGGSFEDSPNNAGASRWTAWAKGGLSW
jgi:hypothetical protein